MNRGEKMAGLVLGIALFAGLFYLIYDSFITRPVEYEEPVEGLEQTMEAGEEEAPPEEELTDEEEAAAPAASPQ
ncbi:MAG TPA: hypothetical protein P5079_09615 [Elusimicrobiota bacterium]|nr:hypothetical protein [Elusimicrobiota bacterium]